MASTFEVGASSFLNQPVATPMPMNRRAKSEEAKYIRNIQLTEKVGGGGGTATPAHPIPSYPHVNDTGS